MRNTTSFKQNFILVISIVAGIVPGSTSGAIVFVVTTITNFSELCLMKGIKVVAKSWNTKILSPVNLQVTEKRNN